jgi:ribose transport system substrate-binding protein
MIIALLTACGSNTEKSGDPAPASSNPSSPAASSASPKTNPDFKHPEWYKEPTEEQKKTAALDNISDVVVSSGPHGEVPYPAKDLQITDEDIAKLKAGKYTAAISLHYSGNDWSTLQELGIKDTLEKYGIKLVASTSANFNDAQQMNDINAIAAMKPNVLFSIPVNAQTVAGAYKSIASAGTKIVFMDQPADGMEAGKDYVSVISADNFGNGMIQADLMAKALGGKGKVAAMYYAPNFLVTNQRYEGFVARMQAKYPDIEIVTAQGFQDPNNTQSVAAAILTKHSDLQGIWVAWDVPAMGAVAAARVAGKTTDNFKITCDFLGNEAALNMAQNGFIKGVGAQRPYDQGVAEATTAALALLGKETHPFVAVPPLAVDRENLVQAYEELYHKKPSDEIMSALK